MKSQIWMGPLLVLAFLFSGCANISRAASPAPTTEPLAVEDKASLLSALEAAGATVEIGQSASQAFFTPDGSIIKVIGVDVQVLEYESPEEMENEASEVSSDGGSIGTSMATWKDAPHFYKAGVSLSSMWEEMRQYWICLKEREDHSLPAGRILWIASVYFTT